MKSTRRWATWCGWAGLILATSLPAVFAADAPQADLAAARVVSRDAWKLAATGHLDDLWARIQKLPEADPAVVDLRRRLTTHRAHQASQQRRIEAAYAKQLTQLEAHLGKGEIEKALVAAASAQGLTDRPKALLDEPTVQKLIAAAVQQAVEHEEAGHWLDALSLYGALERLHENQQKYAEPYQRVAHRVGLLRTYNPKLLFKLYEEQAKRLGEDAPEPWNVEADGWKDRLENIDRAMIADALVRGSRLHVEGATMKQLLLGGVESLTRMLKTRGLEEPFPALGDAEKNAAFDEYLTLVREAILKLEDPISDNEAEKIFELILKRNEQTVALPERVVVHEFGNGAMDKLDDYSSIIWPQQKARFERTTRGKFSGVGIQITLVNRRLTVVTPLDDTPAHRAHIRAGDRIVSIDGKNTLGMDLDQAVEKITGPEGTAVVLGIDSPGAAKTRNVKLIRSSIRIVSIKGWRRLPGGLWDYYIDPDQKIGYVRLTTFGPNSVDDLDRAVHSMVQTQGLEGLIFDLRANPGGRLDAAIGVADRFLEKGVIVSTTGGERAMVADQQKTYPNVPIVVLINEGSASASEIVAGALQVHHRALILGERSFGKGSVQQLYPITKNTAYLKLTTQYYKIPDGRIIHRRPGAEAWGIEPDVAVRMTGEQIAKASRARMILDVLREDGEAFDPETILRDPNEPEDKRKPADDAKPVEDAEEKLPPVTHPTDILERGLDPQLSTALLLIKAKLLDQTATAGR